MSIQIFKTAVPNEDFYSFLDGICMKNEKHYILNKNAYKKGIFTESINTFFEKIRPYYHLSKRKYIDKKMTYNSFTTVIRQICNYNKITFTSQIKYDKSVYDIVYYIYFS
jgi:hypothetical protein